LANQIAPCDAKGKGARVFSNLRRRARRLHNIVAFGMLLVRALRLDKESFRARKGFASMFLFFDLQGSRGTLKSQDA
jgi:hypothetical protein